MSEIGGSIWQAVAKLNGGFSEPFADFMERDAVSVTMFETCEGEWAVAALYRFPPDAAAIAAGLALIAASQHVSEPALTVSPLPPADWLADAYAGFPPRSIGRFYVYGSHIGTPPPGGAVPLLIDAATAFGSGEHATTEGCLRGLDRLARRRPRIARALDMGTGSGILAIAIAKTWRQADIVAVDVDPESVRVAAINARINRVGYVRAVCGDGYKAPLAQSGPKFDLIVSNILARPLIAMAPSLARRLAPGGTAILSGLLARQAPGVLAAHRDAGLHLVGRIPIGEWQTLIMGRK